MAWRQLFEVEMNTTWKPAGDADEFRPTPVELILGVIPTEHRSCSEPVSIKPKT
jgi:hypothetical protein